MTSLNFKKEIEQIKFLKTFSEVAEKTGKQLFVVGGFVRDLILKEK